MWQRQPRLLLDQLGESMVRLGLLQPHFEVEEREFMADGKFAIVVLDTNALRNGAVRHLQEQFHNDTDLDYHSHCHTDGDWRKISKYY